VVKIVKSLERQYRRTKMKVRLNPTEKDREIEIEIDRDKINCIDDLFKCYHLSMSLNTAKLLSAKLDSVLESV